MQQLLFGADHEALTTGRVATIQSVGSSGGLKVGADFIKRWFPGSEVWVSDPTWDNHRSMFEGAGIAVNTYPYYDGAAGGVRFDAMLDTLNTLPAGSVVLLHACCHNPTGVDLTRAQWDELIPLLIERELIPYLDLAYQGFGDGIDEDAYAVRALAAAGASFFVANSFSKSMSVYGERCGALSVVCPDAEQAELVLGQMKFTVRRNYSSPPIHGGQIVAHVLTDADLRPMWESELAAMRERILAMRKSLHGVISAKVPGRELRLLPHPARHVQLHRPERRAGRPAARRVRGLPGALGPHLRGRAEHRQRRAHRAGHGRGDGLRSPRFCLSRQR